MKKTVIIVGSSRKDGNTAKIANQISQQTTWDVIDLNDYQVGYYDYDFNNQNDDFIPLIKQLLTNYDTFVFATPVYWYAMSGIMKVFFDRITDLLEIEKELGYLLREKNMGVISSSIGNNLDDYFWLPFSETANYLGMNYLSNVHTIIDENNYEKINQFIKIIEDKTSDSLK